MSRDRFFKSNKIMVYRKMRLFNFNPRLKENKVIYVQIFNNKETGEKGWKFETEGGHCGRIFLCTSDKPFRFQYKGITYQED